MQYIGKELRNRMDMFEMDITALSEKTFMDESDIAKILNNEITYDDIDKFDLDLIASALHCDAEYFVDENVRNKDLLISTMNRGKDTLKSKNIKAKIQSFMKDYAFFNDVLKDSL